MRWAYPAEFSPADLPLVTETPKASAPEARPAPLPITKGGETLEDIRAEMGDCKRCKLHERRTNLVFGVGNPHARLML
ncbi:MAG: hypothetical protein ACREFI_06700, partial [Stellaceae bacterium]